MKFNFPKNMRYVKNVPRLKVYLPGQKWTMDETIFFQNMMFVKNVQTEVVFARTKMSYE